MKFLKNSYKRITACVLALAVLISALTVGVAVVADSNDTFYEGVKDVPWNGQIATKFAGGNGSESNPYLIETPNQLAYLVKNDIETVDGGSKNKYYKLTANIYLNDIYNVNWKSDEPNSWFSTASSARFKGHLDGDGYTIFGLYSSSSSNVGLFSYADVWFNNVTIKNLTISDSEITTTGNYAGAFIGFAYSSINSNTLLFENCYVTDSVNISTPSGGGTTGGFIGYAQQNKNSIKNSACLATLQGKTVGGFTGGFGNSSGASAENSFAVCSTLGSGINNKTNCYVVTFIARTQWIALRTSGNASIYFDDIMVVQLSDKLYPVPEKEKIPVLNTDNVIEDNSGSDDEDDSEETIIIKKRRKKKKNTESEFNAGLLIAIIVGSVVVLSAVVTVTIILIKRRKKKIE